MMDSNEDLERMLRVALKRQDVPANFLADVMRRAELENAQPISWWQRRSVVLAMAAGIVVAAVIPLSMVEHRKHEQAVVAHRQLVEALQITRTKLAEAKQRIRRKHS